MGQRVQEFYATVGGVIVNPEVLITPGIWLALNALALDREKEKAAWLCYAFTASICLGVGLRG